MEAHNSSSLKKNQSQRCHSNTLELCIKKIQRKWMINELFEISCKTPHFCISLQLCLLKSELIWNIPSSTSSHHGQRRRQKLMWRRLHTPRSSSKVDQGASLRVISSARSLLNDWSYHETLSHIWFITLRTWLPTDANYKALSNRSNFLSITYKTSQKRLQANICYHKHWH